MSSKNKRVRVKNKRLLSALSAGVVACQLAFVTPIFASIPAPPNNFKGVNLKDAFAPAVGNGIAYSLDNSLLQMSDSTSQVGAIWSKKKIDLSKPFTLSCYLYMGNEKGKAADGMTFTLQNYDQTLIGEAGSGLGIYNATKYRTASIEFDTFYNEDGADGHGTEVTDENGLVNFGGNHIAIIGGAKNWDRWTSMWHFTPSELTFYDPYNGQNADSEYLSNDAWKEVTITGTPKGSNYVMLAYKVKDLASGKTYDNGSGKEIGYVSGTNPQMLDSNMAYWGFTSSTGAQYETNAMTFGTLPQTPTISTTDLNLVEGQPWNKALSFVKGMDETAVEFDDVNDPRLTETHTVPVDANGNTTAPGNYTVTFKYKNGDYTGTTTANVIVVENPNKLVLDVPDKMDFGTYQLGVGSPKLLWNTKSQVTVTNSGGKKWLLTAQLANDDASKALQAYLKYKNQSMTTSATEIATDSSKVSDITTTNLIDPTNGLLMDYSQVKSLRDDKGTIAWTLSPSINAANE